MNRYVKYYGDKHLQGTYKAHGISEGGFYKIVEEIGTEFIKVINDFNEYEIYDSRLFDESNPHAIIIESDNKNWVDIKYKSKEYSLGYIYGLDIVSIWECNEVEKPYRYINYIHGTLDKDNINEMLGYVEECIDRQEENQYAREDISVVTASKLLEQEIYKVSSENQNNNKFQMKELELIIRCKNKEVKTSVLNMVTYKELLNVLNSIIEE